MKGNKMLLKNNRYPQNKNKIYTQCRKFIQIHLSLEKRTSLNSFKLEDVNKKIKCFFRF